MGICSSYVFECFKGILGRSVRYSVGCLLPSAMTQNYTNRFTRKGPDVVSEEVALVLFGKPAVEFKVLFTTVYTNLRARKMSGGGEEMMRLRVYEKLQHLVSRGMVDKTVSRNIWVWLPYPRRCHWL